MKSLSPHSNEADLNNGSYLMHNATTNSVFFVCLFFFSKSRPTCFLVVVVFTFTMGTSVDHLC